MKIFEQSYYACRLIMIASAVFAVGCKQNTANKQATGVNSTEIAAISSDLEQLKSRSIALLENGVASNDKEGKGLAEAADGFRKISLALPADPLGIQNLSIALLFQIQNARLQASPSLGSLEKDFLNSISRLKTLSATSSEPWVLEARFYLEKGELDKAEQSLRLAVSKPEAEADTFFQLIELLQSSGKADAPDDVRKLLESAIKISPSNIGLAVYYLNILAVQQDESVFAEQLKKCRQYFAPFASRTGSQLPKLTDSIQSALDSKNWTVVQRLSNGVRNVLLAEIAYQNDLQRLRPHSLEFIRLRFADGNAIQDTASASPLRFELATWDFAGLSAATAIGTEDLDLDGRFDLVVGGSEGIDVYSFADNGPKKIMSATVGKPMSKMVLADLDRDFQYRRESLPASALPTTNPPGSPPSTGPGFADTDIDLVLFGPAGIQLFENVLSADRKDRSLVERPLSDAMAAIENVQAVAAIDLDHDADLDLAIATDAGITLWSNRGNWSFANFTEYSSLPDPAKRYDCLLAIDADRNVLNDFLVGSDQLGLPTMLANNLHGRYHTRDMAWPEEMQGACRAIEAIDVNRDACWDLITCGEKGVRVLTMKSPGRYGWLPDSVATLSDRASTGLLTNDLNNDGLMDCLTWGRQGCELFTGQSAGQMTREENAIQLDQALRHVVTLDFDEDGDDDLVGLGSQGQLLPYKNVDGNKNQQLAIVLRADEDGSQRPRERCNMHGVGCLIELKSDGIYQSQIVRGTRTRFGLGKADRANIMRVVWTNGTPNNILDVSNASTIFDQQRLTGSCPYLYAWNGQRFEFVTDCLWAAPIGLQFGPGILAPTRDWEYLKIDAAALQPKDGKYHLRLTEELWEAAYFDSVQLMSVDHPADVEIFSNEKVGPDQIAEFRIFTVKQRLHPTVKDQHGRRLDDLVAVRDQRYTKTWTQGINQGLTETHWLEIDLNRQDGTAESQSDEKVLFLTGWIFPTCTSLNLSMAENPQRPRQRPPAIQVPDQQGDWVTVIPFSGFPGGKTKTIAIDLKGKFLCNDHRVRLVSNMELCWDEVFFSENERQVMEGSYRMQPLKLETADLHYRGFSQQEMRPNNAPNYYDYSQVIQESVWAPMRGLFTRYGEVSSLLQEADDLQVVMGAGDEVSLEFSEPGEDLPRGWIRDFIIYNVGWDKDADLNTIQGQNVEPLPFRAMKSYPYAPEQQFPDSPAHQEFLRHYQTRLQDAGIFWNQIRDSL